MSDPRNDARHVRSGPRIDASDPTQTDGSADDSGVSLSTLVELGCVSSASCDLGAAIDAEERLFDHAHCHGTSPAISRVRTMVRGGNSTL
jgi:hypothetical protein